MRTGRTGKRAMYREKFIGLSIATAVLVAGPGTADAQDEVPPLITTDELAVLRAEPLQSPDDLAATPERLFLGSCSSCHGTSVVGNGEAERLTQVILHGVHRGEAGNISMPGFAHSMTDAQVADLVGHLAEARTGSPVEVDEEAVAQARAEQQAILKRLDE